jgi:hypothetical protein
MELVDGLKAREFSLGERVVSGSLERLGKLRVES